MKYTEAWSSVVSQNLNLKIATFVLGIVSMILGLSTLKLAFKEAIVIERGCFSGMANKVDDKHSPQEIESFLKVALSQRFNSQVQAVDGLLAIDELNLKNQEQKEFSSRGLKQSILVNSISSIGGDSQFRVDADRIISVGEVRSTFRFPLMVKLESKARSYSNPYGLLLVNIKAIEKDAKEGKGEK